MQDTKFAHPIFRLTCPYYIFATICIDSLSYSSITYIENQYLAEEKLGAGGMICLIFQPPTLSTPSSTFCLIINDAHEPVRAKPKQKLESNKLVELQARSVRAQALSSPLEYLLGVNDRTP